MMTTNPVRLFAVLLFLLLFVSVTAAQQSVPLTQFGGRVPVRTIGGGWLWGDVLYFHDWHIQKNAQTDSCRLLDGNAVQRAYGTFDECRRRLDEIRQEENIPPMSGRAVVIMHGFGSSALTTRKLAQWLRKDGTFDYVFNLSYPSTQGSIHEHAEMLQEVVRNLPTEISRIDFVGHSLGSIVMRLYLSRPLETDKQETENDECDKPFLPDKRVGRFVMMGPPNHGAEIAVKFIGDNPIRRSFAGKSGDELGILWKETEGTLGIPGCPFMIISGGKGDSEGYSKWIPGDDDGIVRTEGTRLVGAVHWQRFNVKHGEMLITEEVFQAVQRFLAP